VLTRNSKARAHQIFCPRTAHEDRDLPFPARTEMATDGASEPGKGSFDDLSAMAAAAPLDEDDLDDTDGGVLQLRYVDTCEPARVSALTGTLHYTQLRYDARAWRPEELEALGAATADEWWQLTVPSGALDDADPDEGATVLRGWQPIFACVSRLAHTLPSDPILSAIVWERIRMFDLKRWADLEALLLENEARSEWVCAEMDLSSAADVYGVACAAEALRVSEINENDHPHLVAYAARDAFARDDDDDDDDDDDAKVRPARGGGGCALM